MCMLYVPIVGLGDTAAFLPRCPPDAMAHASRRRQIMARGLRSAVTTCQCRQVCTTNIEGRLITSSLHGQVINGRAGDAVVPSHPQPVSDPQPARSPVWIATWPRLKDAFSLLLGLTWGRRPTAHTSAYGATVPSRWDETPRAAERTRRACSSPVSPEVLSTVLRCFSKGCLVKILGNKSAGLVSPEM